MPLAQPADTYTPNGLADGVCSDPSVIEAYVNDPMVAKQVSFGLINTIHDGVEWLKANAKSFADPTLVHARSH